MDDLGILHRMLDPEPALRTSRRSYVEAT